jgi:hypothetical protein
VAGEDAPVEISSAKSCCSETSPSSSTDEWELRFRLEFKGLDFPGGTFFGGIA